MNIETERIIIRDPIAEDWHGALSFLADRDVMRWIHLEPEPFTEAQARQWIADLIFHNAQVPPTSHNSMIIERASGKIIGWIGIGTPSPDRAHVGDLDFGYALAQSHWRKGYMTEAVRGMFAFAFDKRDVNTLFAICETRNTGSYRVMEKAGMMRREQFSEPPKEMYLYTISRAEWEATNSK